MNLRQSKFLRLLPSRTHKLTRSLSSTSSPNPRYIPFKKKKRSGGKDLDLHFCNGKIKCLQFGGIQTVVQHATSIPQTLKEERTGIDFYAKREHILQFGAIHYL